MKKNNLFKTKSIKFEAAWKDGFDNFERVFDPLLGKSIKRKINKDNEYFVPSQKGLYKYGLDESIILDKRYGSWKNGSEEFGFQSAISHHIRDEYWKEDATYSLYNKDINVWYLDIETRVGQNSEGFPVPEKALEEISMFQILDTKTNTMFLLGTKDWKHQELYKKYGDNARYNDLTEEDILEKPYGVDFDVKYLNCKDEQGLLKAFFALYQKLDPLLLLAWNGSGFDYPYIYNRMKNLGMNTNELSNYGSVKYKQSEFQGQLEFKIDIDGHFWMDLKEVYQKFDFGNHENYSLDTIAYDELKDRKVNHDEYTAFDDFYTGKYNIPEKPTNDQKRMRIYQEALKGNTEEVRELSHSEFVWYGLKDTHLLQRINEKRKFVDTMLLISAMTGTQLSDSLGTVKIWGQYLSNLMMLDNLVMPKRQEHSQPQVVGGYVREPQKGKHGWSMSVDVNSMYPLLGMVSFNMSPETYIEPRNIPSDLRILLNQYYSDQDEGKRLLLDSSIKTKVTELLQKYNYSLGVSGAVFDKSRLGIVPKTVKNIYLNRKSKQKLMKQNKKDLILIHEEMKRRGLM